MEPLATKVLPHQLMQRNERPWRAKYKLIEKENQRLLRSLCEIARRPTKNVVDTGLGGKNSTNKKYNNDNAQHEHQSGNTNNTRVSQNSGSAEKKTRSSNLSLMKSGNQQGFNKHAHQPPSLAPSLTAKQRHLLSNKSLNSKTSEQLPQRRAKTITEPRNISSAAVKKVQNASMVIPFSSHAKHQLTSRDVKPQSLVNRAIPSDRGAAPHCSRIPSSKPQFSSYSLQLQKQQRIENLLGLLNDSEDQKLTRPWYTADLETHDSKIYDVANLNENDDDLILSLSHRSVNVIANGKALRSQLRTAEEIYPLTTTESGCLYFDESENQNKNQQHENEKEEMLCEIGEIIKELEDAIAITRTGQKRIRKKEKNKRS